jgi:hypothetical protein
VNIICIWVAKLRNIAIICALSPKRTKYSRLVYQMFNVRWLAGDTGGSFYHTNVQSFSQNGNDFLTVRVSIRNCAIPSID